MRKRRLALVFLLSLIAGALIGWLIPVEAAQADIPGPPPTQQNPDVYACCGLPSVFAGWTPGDLSTLNPLTTKLRNGDRTVTYAYVVVNGCSDGNMFNTLQSTIHVWEQLTARTGRGVTYVRIPVGPEASVPGVYSVSGVDVTVRATCGVDAANVGVTAPVVGDLYPGWPYKNTVNVNTIMSTYPVDSQQGIWCHEFVAGHAVATADEQYKKDGSFGSTLLVSCMNTGPLSRVVDAQADIDRWSRVLFDIEPVPVECAWLGFDPCSQTTIYASGWRQTLADEWIDPQGVLEFTGCNADRLRWSPPIARWVTQGSGFYNPVSGIWALTPQC